MSSEKIQDLKWKPAVKKLDNKKRYFFGAMTKGFKLDATDKLIAIAKGADFTYCLIERPHVADPEPLKKLDVFATAKKETKKALKKVKVVKPKKVKKVKKVKKPKTIKKVVKPKKVKKPKKVVKTKKVLKPKKVKKVAKTKKPVKVKKVKKTKPVKKTKKVVKKKRKV